MKDRDDLITLVFNHKYNKCLILNQKLYTINDLKKWPYGQLLEQFEHWRKHQ